MKLQFISGSVLFAYLQFSLALNSVFAQFTFNANSELGYYRNTGSGIFGKNDIVSRLDLKGKYEYEVDENYFAASASVRPELYGLKDNLKGIKIIGNGSFYDNSGPIIWGINFSEQKNIFRSSELNINTDFIFLTSDFFFNAVDNLPLHLMAGYAYQSYNYSGRKNFDILFLDSRYEDILFDDINFFSGLYLERFLISNKSNSAFINLQDKNIGWRIGPQVGINYLQSILLRIEYRILFHFSDITKSPSYEQNYKVLAGANLSESLSVFLLLDLYLKNFILSENFTQVREIIYSPMNSENRFYVKLLYDLNENLGVYTRYGYGKEIIDYFDTYLEGWNLVAGLELNY